MKVSQYNSIYDFPSNPSQKLMFNAKSLALALVDCSKVEQYENYCQTHEEIPDEAFLNDLKTGGFLIDDSIDEKAILKYEQLCSRYSRSHLSLVIAATSNCNFRCVYCYERSVLRASTMSEATQEAIVKFVESEAPHLESFTVTWYGGEPLLALDIIESHFIKTNSIESSFRKRVDDSFAKFTSAKVNDSYLQYLISVLQSSISLLSQLILLIVGAQCVYNDKITIGLLITFSTYFSQVQNGILYFLNLGSSYQNARVSSQRIHDILSKSKEPSGHKKFSPPLSVSCKNLSFTFSDENRFLYENVSFSLQPGKIYGLSGKNGAGKTTFINILLGLYNDIIPRDMISFNGIDIHDIDIHWLREKISYVSQESTIVPATYQDNLLFLPEGNFPSKINADRIIHLLNAKTLNPSDFIASSSLSGGEARKICLLRSFLKDSDFLILDEPDASLDQESCLQLVKHLQQLKSKKTILLVSHNPIFVNCCDEIICL